MKNCKLLALACLIWAAMPVKADLAPTVMLHRGGEVKTYMYNQVQNAVDDAVDGDTIFLSEGTFQPFNVNKRILVRGTGPTTIIEGSCEINISGLEKLKMPVLDALSFNGDVEVENAFNQFTLRKCSMNNLIFNKEEGKEYNDVKIDRCYIDNCLNLPNNVIAFNGFNSRIYTLYPHDYTGHATFEHCNITHICDTIQGGVFNSCSLYNCNYISGAKSRTNLIGCVLNSCTYKYKKDPPLSISGTTNDIISGFNCSFLNCVSVNNSGMNYNGSQISSLDGTKIGAYGGQHPFNLYPEIPGVKKHEISIDAATRTMTVTLTVDKLDK